MNDLSIIIRAVDRASQVMRTVGGAVDNLTRKTSGGLARAWDTLSTKSQAAASQLQGPMIAAIAGVGIAATLAGGTIMRFDDAMLQLEATSGATSSQMAELREQAKEMGKTTRFSAIQAAEGQNFLAMAGFDVNETLKALPATLDLAAAGNLDLARSADIVSNIMGQFQIEAEDTSRVTNVLAATASSSNTNIEQLAEAMKYLGPTAAALKIPLEDTAAIVATLGDAGIQGSLAGRALGSSLVRLSNPTKKMQGAMDALNLSAFDSNGQFVGMTDVLKQLEAGTKSMTDEQKAANLNAVFGAEAFQEMNILLNRGSEAYDEYSSSITDTNRAQEMAAIRASGLSGVWLGIKSALEAMQIGFGDTVVAGKSMSDWAGELGAQFLDLARQVDFQATFDWMSDNIPIVAGVLAGLAGVLGSIYIPVAVTAAAATAAALWPFLAFGAAVGLLVWAFTSDFMGIQGILGQFGEWIGVFDTASGSFDPLMEKITLVQEYFQSLVDSGFQPVIDFFQNNFAPELETAAAFIEMLQSTWETFFNFIGPIIGGFINLVLILGANIVAGLVYAWEQVREPINGFIQAVYGLIETLMPIIMGIIMVIMILVNFIAMVLTPVFQILWAFVIQVFAGIMKAITGVIEIITGILDVFIGVITGLFTGDFSQAAEGFEKIWEGLKTFVEGIVQLVLSPIVGLIDGIKNTFATIDLYQAGRDIINGLINGVSSMAGALSSKVRNMAQSITNTMKSTLGIRSPARVILKEVMAEGVEPAVLQGIARIIPRAEAETEQLSQAIIPRSPSSRDIQGSQNAQQSNPQSNQGQGMALNIAEMIFNFESTSDLDDEESVRAWFERFQYLLTQYVTNAAV